MPVIEPDLQPVIACRDVCVSYGRQQVLRNVCLEIPRGAFIAFVGPNGAGKTTLLRVMLGLIKPQRGRVITPHGALPPGYVPQQRSIDPLYPVSVRQIAAMGLYPRLGWWRRPRSAERQLVQNALDRFGLTGHANKTFGELSGGMKQKALLARAFISGADVFVMDEPTLELDEQSERDVLAHLLSLSRDEGKTVLLAIHGMSQIARLSPRICTVDRGHVRLEPPSDVPRSSLQPTTAPADTQKREDA